MRVAKPFFHNCFHLSGETGSPLTVILTQLPDHEDVNMSSQFARTTTETTSDAGNSAQNHPIVFFDGVCGLCNWSVDFILERDRDAVLKFAPLQGETAERLLAPAERDLNSIVFRDGQSTYRHSSAVVRILWKLPQPWSVLGTLLWLIPKPIRDLGYFLTSRLRYRLFGKRDVCRMPKEGEAERMLA